MRVAGAILSAGLLASLALASASAAAQPVKIRMAYVVPVTGIGSILLRKPDLMRNHGKTYVFEAVRFQGTPQMNTGIAVGEIEIAQLGATTLGLAIHNAGMRDLRIVADEIRDGVKGRYSNVFAVRDDSPIRRVEDLKGKLTMSNGAGSGVDVAMRIMLANRGLEAKRDYTIVEAPLPTVKAMLKDRKVDLVPNVLPFSNDPEMKTLARTLFTSRDAFEGESYLGIWVAKEDFIKKNRAAMVDFLEDAMRTVRWYIDPANQAEAVKIASETTKLPPAVFASWLFNEGDYFRDRDLKVNPASLQANLDMLHKHGFLKEKIDAAAFIDMSLVEEAAKRLK